MRTERDGPIVTLDGPAGSGKSSTARAVSQRLGFRHLDSGALYRALTYALLDKGVDVAEWDALTKGDLEGLGVSIRPTEEGFTVLVGGRPVDAELRTPDVTEGVSLLARLAPTRSCLLDLQRSAGAHGRLVADGRDMGTVVFPDAEVKVYLVADLAERARRRLLEEGTDPAEPGVLDTYVRSIEARDRRDSERSLSPLKRPDGAHEIDTTGMDFDAQVDAIVDLVRRLTPS